MIDPIFTPIHLDQYYLSRSYIPSCIKLLVSSENNY